MSLIAKMIAFAGILLLILPRVDADQTIDMIGIYGIIVRLIAFLLGMIGSVYLAAELWQRGERGSESWKYLCISMLMFTLWNIIMAFGIMLGVLNGYDTNYVGSYGVIAVIIKVLDPLIEVIAFIVLLFGLMRIIKAMRNKPWTVFSKEEPDG